MSTWSPTSWKNFRISQQASYSDKNLLNQVLAELSNLPPLVSVEEIKDLKSKFAQAAKGEAFVLQGGDCAELFSDCNAEAISSKLKILLQMSLVLVHGLNKPVVKVGRMAGQYAKPRSADTEEKNGEILPCYRGDLINHFEFSKQNREPNPKRLLKGYSFASLTLNYIRTLIENKFTDFSNIENWDLEFLSHSPQADEYHDLIFEIKKSISLLETITQSHLLQNQATAKIIERVFTCHEALHLHYEQALTRQVIDCNGQPQWYNLSTHLPWIGMRTAQLDSAHVEYMRGIENPVGIKISASVSTEHLLKLLELIDPNNSPGKIVLITRFGHNKITDKLPKLIQAVQREGRLPLWVSDPMHGNTDITESGVKTRNFDNIINEVSQAFKIHQNMGSHLGGVHFELTGDHVTECIGGARGLAESDLNRAYKSLVDPRLNAEQSLEMAMRIVQLNQQFQRNINNAKLNVISSNSNYKE